MICSISDIRHIIFIFKHANRAMGLRLSRKQNHRSEIATSHLCSSRSLPCWYGILQQQLRKSKFWSNVSIGKIFHWISTQINIDSFNSTNAIILYFYILKPVVQYCNEGCQKESIGLENWSINFSINWENRNQLRKAFSEFGTIDSWGPGRCNNVGNII